jgi:hypothetical protein
MKTLEEKRAIAKEFLAAYAKEERASADAARALALDRDALAFALEHRVEHIEDISEELLDLMMAQWRFMLVRRDADFVAHMARMQTNATGKALLLEEPEDQGDDD